MNYFSANNKLAIVVKTFGTIAKKDGNLGDMSFNRLMSFTLKRSEI